MLFRDPLSTEDADAGAGRPGPSLWAVLALVTALAIGFYAYRHAGPEPGPNVDYANEPALTPHYLEGVRALPPELQLTAISVQPYATEADIYCETLEPVRMQIRCASAGGSEITTQFWSPRPERLHLLTLEGLKPETDYRFQLTSIEPGTGLPRVTRRGGFRTLKTDEPPAAAGLVSPGLASPGLTSPGPASPGPTSPGLTPGPSASPDDDERDAPEPARSPAPRAPASPAPSPAPSPRK